MNSRAIRAIALKDLRAIFANLQVWLPMLIVPIMLGVILPTIIVVATRFGGDSESTRNLLQILDKLPASALKSAITGLDTRQKLIYMMTNYMLAPFFLIIPLMTSSVISADSFAGEKERGTLESLLFTPVDLRSLFLGKVLAAFLPSVGLSVASLLLCGVAVNLAGFPLFGHLFFPTLNWLPLMLLVIPTVSLATIFLNLFISARVATFQAAYQLGGMVVLPAVLLVAAQASGIMILGTGVMLIIGLVLALLDGFLLRIVVHQLDRSSLFESQIR